MWENTADGRSVFIFDDGSAAGYSLNDPTMNVWSRDIGSTQWVDDPSPAPAGFFARDAVEQQRMGAAYPNNGQSWDWNAATLGVSRLIDSASRAYATANGTYPGSYAGQNGATFAIGRNRAGGLQFSGGAGIVPLLLIGGALLLLMK